MVKVLKKKQILDEFKFIDNGYSGSNLIRPALEKLRDKISVRAIDKIYIHLQGMIAEYERAKIMERSRRGKIHNAKMGNISVLSSAPYGYRYINKQTNVGQAALEINIEEAEIVKKIFFWIGKDRCSMMEISRKLKNMSIKSPKGEIHSHRSTIWYILKNPIYIGQAGYGRTKTIAKIIPIRPKKGSKEHT